MTSLFRQTENLHHKAAQWPLNPPKAVQVTIEPTNAAFALRTAQGLDRIVAAQGVKIRECFENDRPVFWPDENCQ